MEPRYGIYQGRFEHPDERNKAVQVMKTKSFKFARFTMLSRCAEGRGDFFIVDLRVGAVIGAAWCIAQEITQ